MKKRIVSLLLAALFCVSMLPAAALADDSGDLPVYTVTVENGTGGGDYAEGESVTITANEPEPGMRFKAWTGADGLSFTGGSAASEEATFGMPAGAVTVTASYEEIPPAAAEADDPGDLPVYTVTVDPGPAPGDAFTLSSADEGRLADSRDSAEKGQFFYEDGALYIKLPDCPFSSDEFTFVQWNLGNNLYAWPGDVLLLSGNLTIAAEFEIALNITWEPIDPNFGSWTKTSDSVGMSGDLEWEITLNPQSYAMGVRLQALIVSDPSGKVLYEETNIIETSSRICSGVLPAPASSLSISTRWSKPEIKVIVSNDGHGYAYATYTVGRDGKTTATLTVVPDDGYVFDRWEDISSGIRWQSDNTILLISGDVEVMAHFKPATYLNITFDPQGGTVSPASMLTQADLRLANLPTPEREGWKFGGWYTAPDGGDKISLDTVFAEETCLYAYWYQDSSYSLTLPDSIVVTPGEEWTPVSVTVSELTMVPGERKLTPEYLLFISEHGSLVLQSGGEHTIPFMLSRDQLHFLYQGILNYHANGTQTLFIHIAEADWSKAVPGTYTGSLPYFSRWGYPNHTWSDNMGDGSIPITLTIPEAEANYTVTVLGGTGGGDYAAGESVTITADEPAPGMQFKEWIGADGLSFISGSAASATAIFTMPAGNVTVTASYEDIPSSYPPPPPSPSPSPSPSPTPIAPSYTVVGGGNGAWTRDSGTSYTVTVKRDQNDSECFSHFTGAAIDGLALPAGDYSATAGSTVLTLKAAMLQKLSVGAHTLTLLFDDGTVSTRLTVNAAPSSSSPRTGDDSPIALWAALTALSALGLAAVVIGGKKRRQAK